MLKTTLNTVNTSLNYQDVLKLCVCGIENSDCMLHHCDLCPDQTVVRNFLKKQLVLNYIIDDLIKYKQWISNDRSNLEEHDFLDKLTSMFFELTEYHFIAKKQGEVLRVEAVLILDFAENYSFVAQDCTQSYHWNNAQATFHLFVLYYLNPVTKEISSASFSCISNYMTQNTITVYVFLKNLINDHIKTRYPFFKRDDDGSQAQYKNYKNFTNLLIHKKDFGMKAE